MPSIGVFGVRSAEHKAVLKKWEPLVHHLVKKYAWKLRFWFDYEDLLSEGREALVRAHDTYNPADKSGAGFRTYAYTIIINALNRMHHYSRAAMRKDLPKSFSVDDEENDFQLRSDFVSAEAQLMLDEQAAIVRSAIYALKGQDLKVLKERLWAERSLQEIGTDIGVSRERVRQIEQRALRKLFEALGVPRSDVSLSSRD